MALLDDVKLALRISSSAFNSEISDLIAAAKADLKLSGVAAEKVEDEMDPLIKRAVITYVKAHFGYDNPEAERFAKSYDLLKAHLTLSQEYTQAPAVSDGAT
ncbi:MAG: DNA-packaging protein [Bacillus thermozeamaize]|uniref:DNA-packaging protein n=1 Tax=Bacillus thermozeamaize TaxID=230954 RepID=A0A1Y3PED2_9BACI|nr:MAG: DNA-packaging protein [Bacillus thermozeamaize]